MSIGSGIQQMFGGVADLISPADTSLAWRGRELQQARAQSEWAAMDALRQGALSGAVRRMNGTSVAAAQRVAYAGAGIDATTGTAARVQSATDAQTEFAASMEMGNARRAALGHKMASSRYALQLKANEAAQDQQEADTMLRYVGGGLKVGAGFFDLVSSAVGGM